MVKVTDIPDASRALPVIRDWLKHAFFSLNSTSRTQVAPFTVSMTELARLAFVVDQDAVESYLTRTECYAPREIPAPAWLKRRDGTYVIHDLVSFLQGPHESKATLGVVFIKYNLGSRCA